jgi:hypothetical protein
MKKQVIIDKGNGLQQRLSYDDGTNKIIPETTFGPRQTDNVLPVVGKNFIDDTDLSVAYGDCLFCKGRDNSLILPFNTQCAILSGIEISYSPCAGPLYQTVLYTINYKGIPLLDHAIHFTFFDQSGKAFAYSIYQDGFFPYSFFLHQGYTDTVKIRVIKNDSIGECVLNIVAKGATPFNLYKDIDKMKVIYDINTKNIKYINLNKVKNLDYIDVLTIQGNSFKITRLLADKIYKIPASPVGIPGSVGDFFWTNQNNLKLIGDRSKAYGDAFNNIAVLGYESMYAGFWSNLFLMEKGIVPDGPRDTGGTGG